VRSQKIKQKTLHEKPDETKKTGKKKKSARERKDGLQLAPGKNRHWGAFGPLKKGGSMTTETPRRASRKKWEGKGGGGEQKTYFQRRGGTPLEKIYECDGKPTSTKSPSYSPNGKKQGRGGSTKKGGKPITSGKKNANPPF